MPQLADELEQLREASGSTGAVGLDIAVFDLAADLLGDRRRDPLWRGSRRSPCDDRPVAFEPMADVEALLEVVAQREVEERPLLRGQLHRRRETALDDCQVTGRQVTVEVVHIGDDLETGMRGSEAGSIRGPATTIMRRSGTLSLAKEKEAIARRSRSAPTPDPPTVTMRTRSSSP